MSIQSIQNDDRENELFEEAKLLQWDVMMLTETWRRAKEEAWRSDEGHLFLGAGCTDGRREVAIVVHSRNAKGYRSFHAVNERVCALDIDIRGVRLRMIYVYMLDGSYNDDVVEEIYQHLGNLCTKGMQLRRQNILAGDWNAVVGLQNDGEELTLGPYGAGERNARGEWMVNWALAHKLAIANTHFCRPLEEPWTYIHAGATRQLDYFLVG
jgi:exonuclease III